MRAKATPAFIVPVIKPSILRIFWIPFLRGQILGRLQIHLVGSVVKDSIFLKNSKIDLILSKKGLINWYIRVVLIIKCGIWQPVKFQLISHFLNWIKTKMIFSRIFELMLAILILWYDKKIISFQEPETNWNFTDCQVPHFMIVLMPYTNLLNLSWILKCLCFEQKYENDQIFLSENFMFLKVKFSIYLNRRVFVM